MADVFQNRLQPSREALAKEFAKQIDVTPERQFLGMDGYRKAIDAMGRAASSCWPRRRPSARCTSNTPWPRAATCSWRSRSPSMRRAFVACSRPGEAAAKKNLKIAGGLMSRHYPPLEEAIAAIHDGAIGEVITAWAYREHDPAGLRRSRPA